MKNQSDVIRITETSLLHCSRSGTMELKDPCFGLLLRYNLYDAKAKAMA